ncbi:MAG: TolC family protein [Bacteroidota bacterium]
MANTRGLLQVLVFTVLASPSWAQVPLPSSLTEAIDTELGRLLGPDRDSTLAVVSYASGSSDAEAVLVETADPLLVGSPEGVVTRPGALARDLDVLRRALGSELPGGPLAILVRPDLAADPEAGRRVRGAATEAGFSEVETVSVDTGALPEGTRVAYLDAGTGLDDGPLADRLDALAEQGVLVFAAAPRLVRLGALASASPPYEGRLAREVALAVQERLDGRVVEDMPLRPLPPVRFSLNEATARRLGVSIPWGFRLEADVMDTGSVPESALTLDQAIREAANGALAVRAEAFAVRANQEEVGLARSAILPQVGVASTARVINDDLARVALGGAEPEWLVTVGAQLSQVLFDEPAFAGVAITRRVAIARGFDLAEARLDAADRAASGFVDLLRAETGASIERATLTRTRTNLEAARLRRTVGSSGPAAVARLEAEVAQSRGRLAQVLGAAEAARVALNGALNRALNEPVAPQVDVEDEVSPGEAPGRLPGPDASGFTRAPDPLRIARAFAADALSSVPGGAPPSPEAARAFAGEAATLAARQSPAADALRSIVAARQRSLSSARRAFVLPSLRLDAGANVRLLEDGAGTEPPPPGLPIPPFPDETWRIGVTLSYPLVAGGARSARVRQARAEVESAQTQLDLVIQGVQVGARAAAQQLSANAAAFEQSLEAARAAQEAYDVVSELYREGLASLLDLLDAETALRIAEQLAAQSAFDVVESTIGLQRATGAFDALDDSRVTDPDAVLNQGP